MASGYQVDGDDFENLCAPKGPFAGANVVGFSGISTLFAAREDYQYMIDPFPRGRYFDKGIDLAGLLCKKGYRPLNTYRWKSGGTYAGGGETFYIWKPDANTIRVSNASGSQLANWANRSEIVFFRLSGGGGGGGGSSWTKDGSGGGGAGCCVGWARIPITSSFSSGIKVVRGAHRGASSITGSTGSVFTCNGGGEASGRTRGLGGGMSADYTHADFTVRGTNGGAGANSGGTAGGTSVSMEVYSGASVSISGSAHNNGGGSGGSGGASIGNAYGYGGGNIDGAGGVGAYNGAGNSDTWKYGASGAFYLYF